jgi:hypothetical protein
MSEPEEPKAGFASDPTKLPGRTPVSPEHCLKTAEHVDIRTEYWTSEATQAGQFPQEDRYCDLRVRALWQFGKQHVNGCCAHLHWKNLCAHVHNTNTP